MTTKLTPKQKSEVLNSISNEIIGLSESDSKHDQKRARILERAYEKLTVIL